MNPYSTGVKTIYIFSADKNLLTTVQGVKACAEYLGCSESGVKAAIKDSRVVQGCYYLSYSEKLTIARKKVNRNVLEGTAFDRDMGRNGRRVRVPVGRMMGGWHDDEDDE